MNPNLKIEFAKIGKRATQGLGVAAGVAALKPELLTSAAGLLALLVLAVLSAFPVAEGSVGVFRPSEPGQVSLAKSLADAFASILAAPKAKREAAVAAAFQAQMQAYGPQIVEAVAQKVQEKTGQFNAAQLGQAIQVVQTLAVAEGAIKSAAPESVVPETVPETIVAGNAGEGS